jgi:hypothetical protein
MGIRTKVDINVQAGMDNALDDLIFERDNCDTLDTLDRACAKTILLEAGTSNYSIPFGDVAQARLIYIEGDGEFEVALGGAAAAAAVVTGSGGSFTPTGFAGGETLTLEVDNVATPVTFLVGDTSLADVVNRINAAIALAGLSTPGASDVAGQLRLTSPTTGDSSEIDIQGGTALATLGLSVAVTNGTNATPGTSDLSIDRPADPAGASAAAGVASYFLATVNTTSVQVSNPSATTDVNLKVLIVGDLTASP